MAEEQPATRACHTDMPGDGRTRADGRRKGTDVLGRLKKAPAAGLLCCCLTGAWPGFCAGENLLSNPGFEAASSGQRRRPDQAPEGWLAGWKVENARGTAKPYYYRIAKDGGGHGSAKPLHGANAIEIYSSGKVARLSQTMTLKAGRYRLGAYVRNNGSTGTPRIKFSLAGKEIVIPALSDSYRFYYGDFKLDRAGPVQVGLVSANLGLAVDDISLVPLPDDFVDRAPYIYFDLIPTSADRDRGLQYCIKGQWQWVNFAVTCVDKKRLKRPLIMRIKAPTIVEVAGFSKRALAGWKHRTTESVDVVHETETVKGVRHNVYSFAFPRFIEGFSKPLQIGGFWVKPASSRKTELVITMEDRGRLASEDRISLVTVAPPAKQVTPKRVKTIAYHVQNWKQSPEHRLEALPEQFALMGFNVWSDYQLVAATASPKSKDRERVQLEAYEQYGVRDFWPNYSSLFNTWSWSYPDLSKTSADRDVFVVNARGQANKKIYNMRYLASNGKAWRDSVMAAFQRTLSRPKAAGLPFRNTGFINNALEGLLFSYDPTTLRDFAKTQNLAPEAVDVAAVNGRLKRQWLLYNMDLYARIVRNWVRALREVDPKVVTVNTLGTFGPSGSHSLSVREQMTWARTIDFTMPQWYGSMRYYWSGYSDRLQKGLAEKVYGKENGHADVLPLLNVSMSIGLEDPQTLRFKAFDYLSRSSVVKGVGYYQAMYAFADGRFMVGLSRAHTLLAQVEDYYVLGEKADQAASFTQTRGALPWVRGRGADGHSAMVQPKVTTSVRVHRLNTRGRIALLTIISHGHGRYGDKGVVKIKLRELVDAPADKVVINWLDERVIPLRETIAVDTTRTGNLGLLEIANRAWARRAFE